jgi:hypothetical protein
MKLLAKHPELRTQDGGRSAACSILGTEDTMDRRDKLACCLALVCLLWGMSGCSTDGAGIGLAGVDSGEPTPPRRGPAGVDVIPPVPGIDAQPAEVWKNLLTAGADIAPDGLTLIGEATSFPVSNGRVYFRVETVEDIAGRSVVIYVGDYANIPGSMAGPASGHVAVGMVQPQRGVILYRACLTTNDRSKDGWNIGLVCEDVAAAQITGTP